MKLASKTSHKLAIKYNKIKIKNTRENL